MKIANQITNEQMAQLEPLYPKWVQFKNERTLQLSSQQAIVMGRVWSEVMGKRWIGGCQACTVNAFSSIMSIYDAELDRRYKAIHEQTQADATPKKKPRRIQK
jgi:hypothetical protein